MKQNFLNSYLFKTWEMLNFFYDKNFPRNNIFIFIQLNWFYILLMR